MGRAGSKELVEWIIESINKSPPRTQELMRGDLDDKSISETRKRMIGMISVWTSRAAMDTGLSYDIPDSEAFIDELIVELKKNFPEPAKTAPTA